MNSSLSSQQRKTLNIAQALMTFWAILPGFLIVTETGFSSIDNVVLMLVACVVAIRISSSGMVVGGLGVLAATILCKNWAYLESIIPQNYLLLFVGISIAVLLIANIVMVFKVNNIAQKVTPHRKVLETIFYIQIIFLIIALLLILGSCYLFFVAHDPKNASVLGEISLLGVQLFTLPTAGAIWNLFGSKTQESRK